MSSDPRKNTKYNSLYFNGLERTQVGKPERALARYLGFRGVELDHASVGWHSKRSFQELFDESTEQAEQKLRQHGRLALVGASAGGSLALNVFGRLRENYPGTRVSMISLSGRLHRGDPEHLEHSALHRPGKKPSPAFIDSVIYCSETTLPQLADTDKLWIRTVHPLADEAVPISTMGIVGVQDYLVPIRGHVPGIALGAIRIPGILDDIYAQ